MSRGLVATVKRLNTGNSRGLDEVHVHGYADLDNVDGVAGLTKFFDGPNDDVGFNAGEFRALFVHVVVVADEFQKKWNVRGQTFLSYALDPRGFLGIDCGRAKRRIVEKDFDGVGAKSAKFCGGKPVEEAGKASRNRFV